mmetsp:Transcript_21485/g.35391  ORF Transcript_21485/g.35391 Transcript_21485/m.35391 type:complete len:188 (-) Transcript_21485:287-850(-)
MQNTSTAAPEKISQPDQDLNAKILSLSVDEGRGVESSAASTAIEWEDITGDGGVLKYLIRTGTGDQHGASGDKVSVHYVGTLKDSGEEFDSSRKTNYPYKFVLGGGTVISGWERAVPSMLVGETARFEIRSDYAYGDAGDFPLACFQLCILASCFAWFQPLAVQVLQSLYPRPPKWMNFQPKTSFWG